MYIDSDGETILETVEEMRNFRNNTECLYCVADAQDLIVLYENENTDVVRLVFTTTCDHKGE